MCHIRPLRGLGLLRGALIQPQNQRALYENPLSSVACGAPLPEEGG